jgi:heme/copper-type cytochrome/quinol oxidase subunit 3
MNHAIPYTVERRPDTGVNNVQLGVWLFLASEAMLFGGLFSAYFTLRAGSIAPWTPLVAHRLTGLINTAVLAGAGLSLALALKAGRAGRHTTFNRWLASAAFLALAFLGVKGFEYRQMLGAGLTPATNNQMGMYYLLTAVHALHVVGGLIATVWLLTTGARTWSSSAAIVANRAEAIAIYWYFVDTIWVILFVLLYVV